MRDTSMYQSCRARLEAALMEEEREPEAFRPGPLLTAASDALLHARLRFWRDGRWFGFAEEAVSVIRSLQAQLETSTLPAAEWDRFMLQQSLCATAHWTLLRSRFAWGAKKRRLRNQAGADLRAALRLADRDPRSYLLCLGCADAAIALYRLEGDRTYLEVAESSLSRVVALLAQQGDALSPLARVSIHESLGRLYDALADLAIGTAIYHHAQAAYGNLRAARNEAALMGEEDLVENLQVLSRRAKRRFETLTPTVAWAS
jgi:hypothetical protein